MTFPIKRFIKLIFGLFLYALGVVFAIQANIGYAPWTVFHAGLASTLGMTIGLATISVGALIVILDFILGEKVGMGTILNMLLIGTFMDGLLALDLIPASTTFAGGVMLLIAGQFIIALASYFYIGSAFGAGPRDSLMIALARKTGFPIGICRSLVEVTAVIVGWQLGGMVGVGTIIAAFGIGFCVQITFQALHFDTTAIEHETLAQTFSAKGSQAS
jgi:uncharacterized membrane protein YczE